MILHLHSLDSPPEVVENPQTPLPDSWVGHLLITINEVPGKVEVSLVNKDLEIQPAIAKDYLRLASRSDLASVFNSVSTEKKRRASRLNGLRAGKTGRVTQGEVKKVTKRIRTVA
jgi:hypothetical protein